MSPNLLGSTVSIGLIAFTLAFLGFARWARKLRDAQDEIRKLVTEKHTLYEESRMLKCHRDGQVRASSFYMSLYLTQFLEECQKENLQDEEVMRRYNAHHSGKPVGLINALDMFGVGDAGGREGLKTPDNPEEIQKLASYFYDVGLKLR